MSVVPVVLRSKFFVEIPFDRYDTQHPKAVYEALEVIAHGEHMLYVNPWRLFYKRDFLECDGPARLLNEHSYMTLIDSIVQQKLLEISRTQ